MYFFSLIYAYYIHNMQTSEQEDVGNESMITQAMDAIRQVCIVTLHFFPFVPINLSFYDK